jgi:hypothetical protein
MIRKLSCAVLVALMMCALALPAWADRDDPPPNDWCEGAFTIGCGGINLSGSTEWAFNDYDLGYDNPCTGWMAMGYDVTYKFTVVAGTVLNVVYSTTADGSFYVMTNCDDPGSCVTGADENPYAGVPEEINYTFTTGGTYYLILDAYSPDEWGEWTLVGTLGCPSAVNSASWGIIKALYK